MDARTNTRRARFEREALRDEIESARHDMADASRTLRQSLNPMERARSFARERPITMAMATLASGAVAAKLLPSLIWRKGGFLGRFTGQLARSAAGIAVPFVANLLIRRSHAEPRVVVLPAP